MNRVLLLSHGGGSHPTPPKPVRRSPLVFPTCGSCPAPDSFDKTLPFVPPTDDPRFLRANCWGIPVYVNGVPLPFLPGIGSSEHPERFLSYFFPLYPKEYQEQWFVENHLRGYTHVVFSWPNARAQAGQSLAQFRADCQRAKDQGFKVHVKLWSKDFDAHDMSLAEWKAYAQPIFDALRGVVDEYSCWEYDAGNLSDDTVIAVHEYLGTEAHAQGATFWCHFFPNHGFWWEGHEEIEFYQRLRGFVDGLDLQTDPAFDIGQCQSHIVDHLRDTAPAGALLRAFEPGTPTLMFTRDHPNEDEADAFGFLTTCTKGMGFVWGFGAGSRLPNGWPE